MKSADTRSCGAVSGPTVASAAPAVPDKSIAILFLGLGDKEHAMEALERAYRIDAGYDLFLIKVDPMLDDLRGDPRFEALAGKILAPKS
jgi:hypothetical protein